MTKEELKYQILRMKDGYCPLIVINCKGESNNNNDCQKCWAEYFLSVLPE